MSMILWTIYVNGQYAGRTWQAITTTEQEVLDKLALEGYGPGLTVELGDLKVVECQN